ncbi:TPA: SMEK domain-containing protein [Klebsiella pneumoniae]
MLYIKLTSSNLNKFKYNYPAIDLGDIKSKRCVQITSTSGKTKFDKTIEKFISHNINSTYNHISFVIINTGGIKKQKHPTLSTDYINLTDLLKEISNLDIEEIKKILNHSRKNIFRHENTNDKTHELLIEICDKIIENNIFKTWSHWTSYIQGCYIPKLHENTVNSIDYLSKTIQLTRFPNTSVSIKLKKEIENVSDALVKLKIKILCNSQKLADNSFQIIKYHSEYYFNENYGQDYQKYLTLLSEIYSLLNDVSESLNSFSDYIIENIDQKYIKLLPNFNLNIHE